MRNVDKYLDSRAKKKRVTSAVITRVTIAKVPTAAAATITTNGEQKKWEKMPHLNFYIHSEHFNLYDGFIFISRLCYFSCSLVRSLRIHTTFCPFVFCHLLVAIRSLSTHS